MMRHLKGAILAGCLAGLALAQSAPPSGGAAGVDLTSSQTVGGVKTFTSGIRTAGATFNSTSLFLNEGGAAPFTIISPTGTAASNYLQHTIIGNTWNFLGGAPNVQVNTRSVVTGPGTTPLYLASGRTAATAGSLAVTFSPAFGAVPSCTCTGESANVCSISVAPTTSGVTFLHGAGTAIINWQCVGNR